MPFATMSRRWVESSCNDVGKYIESVAYNLLKDKIVIKIV